MTPAEVRASLLRDEIHDLTIIVRSLEFSMGFAEGVQAGRWQGAQTEDNPMVGEAAPEGPGAAAGPAH